MITKEEFTEYILNYQAFEQSISRMEEAFCGRPHGCDLFECDWVNSVDKMLDIFIESHFTETGGDWIFYYQELYLEEQISHSAFLKYSFLSVKRKSQSSSILLR